eukprot:g5733.t1
MTEVERMLHTGSEVGDPFHSSLVPSVETESPRPAEVFGNVHSLESFSTVDGPGIRYMVFTQGCPSRCLFCCNPDTWNPDGGQRMSSHDIADKMRRTLPFMKSSGGGITVSGGEALLQPEFVSALFQEAHEMGVDTCLDTTGQGCLAEKLDEVLPHTDLVLLCIKHMRKEVYKKITRRRINPMLKFVTELNNRRIPFWVRYVLVPGLTMESSDIDLLCEFCIKQSFIKGIELLPYHTLGVEKWKQMGLEYPLADVVPPSRNDVEQIIQQVESYGLTVKCDLSTARQTSS